MNKLYLLLVFLLSTFMDIQGQVVAVKTNVLYDAITTPNVGAEVAFNKHWSVEASGYYNGWTFSSDGGCISYGYQLYVSPRWNVEFTAGFGYLHFEYDKYAFPRGDAPIGKFRNEYWGLTKAGISIVYIIK